MRVMNFAGATRKRVNTYFLVSVTLADGIRSKYLKSAPDAETARALVVTGLTSRMRKPLKPSEILRSRSALFDPTKWNV